MKYILTLDTREPPEIADALAKHPKVIDVLRDDLKDGDIAYKDLLKERRWGTHFRLGGLVIFTTRWPGCANLVRNA